jgi:hypothetical protein
MNNDDLLRGTMTELKVRVAEQVDPPAQLKRLHQTRHRQRVGGAATIGLLFLMVVVGSFLIPWSDTRPISEESTPTSALTTTTVPSTTTTESVSAVPLPEPPAISWTRYDDPAVFGGERQQVINGVTAVPGCAPACGEVEALIAVGFDRSGSDDFTIDAAAWVSSDGRDWRRVVHDEASLGGDRHEAMHDVASNGDRVVAVGAVHADKDLFSQAGAFVTGDSPNDRAAIWLSDDLGETWQRVSLESDPPVLGLSAVAPFGNGFLAAGDGIWVSPDGETWTRTSSDDITDYVDNLADVGSGWMAFGSGDGPHGMWISANGYDWEGVSFRGSPDDQMRDVVATNDGLIGFGELLGRDNTQPAVWQSDQGTSWELLNGNLTGSDIAYPHIAIAIEPIGDWLIAVGNQKTHLLWEKPRWWMSPDQGGSWVELQLAEVFGGFQDPGSRVSDLIVVTTSAGESTTVAVGAWAPSENRQTTGMGPVELYDGAVWIGTLDN